MAFKKRCPKFQKEATSEIKFKSIRKTLIKAGIELPAGDSML